MTLNQDHLEKPTTGAASSTGISPGQWIVIWFSLGLVLISGLVSCTQDEPPARADRPDSAVGSRSIPFRNDGELAFVSRETGDTLATITIEIADSPAERQVGLMYREEMTWDQGMLFIFDHEALQSFWMKNTDLALDIVFVSSGGRIVTIHENAASRTTAPYQSTGPGIFVVEIRAGFSQRFGVKVGDMIRWHRL